MAQNDRPDNADGPEDTGEDAATDPADGGPAADPMAGTRGPARGVLLAVGLFSVGVNLLILTAPLYMIQVYDRVLTTRGVETLIILSVAAIVALAFLGAFDALRLAILARLAAWMETRLQPALLDRMVARMAANRPDVPTGDGFRDLATVRAFLGGGGIMPLFDAPFAPFFLLIVFLIHPVLGWISLGGALVLFAFALMNDIGARGASRDAAKYEALGGGLTQRALRNADTVRGLGMGRRLGERLGRMAAGKQAVRHRATILESGITGGAKAVRFGLQIAILGMGAYLVIERELSPGLIIAASIMMGRALAPFEQAIGAWRTIVGAQQAWARVRGLLAPGADAAGREEGAGALPSPKGALAVEGVTYRPRPDAAPVLQDIAFTAEPGRIVGITGPSGSGKSTLARLLVGLDRPSEGTVTVDGIDPANWRAGDRIRHLGFLPQRTDFFDGTVAENVARFRRHDQAALERAARLAGAETLIAGLPDRYDTVLVPNGLRLSGGQLQRLALMRSFYGDPALLVLDEPDAALDHDGERALLGALGDLRRQGRTIVLVGHKISLMRVADEVHVLTGGRVVDSGAPADLMARRRPRAVPDGGSPEEASSEEATKADG